ncbi:MAG: TonB family protein [Terracidiphilus sp.]|jgi:protein TonB
MASPAEIEKALPDTLPEDFSDWDREESPVTQPVNSRGFEASSGFAAVAKPPAQPAKPQVTVSRTADRLRNSSSFTPAKVYTDDEAFIKSLRLNSKNIGGLKRKSKKKMIVVAVGLILLLLGLIPAFYLKLLPTWAMMRHSAIPQPEAMNNLPATNTLKPSPSIQMTATTPQPATPDMQPTATEAAPPPQVQSKMMNEQLNAPRRIPDNMKMAAGKEAPPPSGFAVADMQGLSGSGNSAMGSVFAGQARSNVNAEPPKVLAISAGIAVGMQIRNTPPVYPQIAKSARVSGAVVLQATISKTGTIENLRVVSGPAMLRQAAVDAVKTWRYKPYVLNNEPVEVETTVNVIFALDK